jgi:hypothetical protein
MGVVKFEGGGGALILGRKMRVDWLEKCLKVGKLTNDDVKVTKVSALLTKNGVKSVKDCEKKRSQE